MKNLLFIATSLFTSLFAVEHVLAQSDTSLNQCNVRFSTDGSSTLCLDNLGNDLLPELVDCEDLDGDGWGWNDRTSYGPPGVGSCIANANLVSNGSFDGGSTGWNTYLHPDSVAGPYVLSDGSIADPNPHASNFSFHEGGVTFSFRQAGTQWWHSQLFTDPISLEGGRNYRLSFFATTSPRRGGGISGSVVVENGTDYTKYLDRQEFGVAAFDSRYQYAEFYVPVSDSNARVTFNLGDSFGALNSVNIGSFEIVDVKLIALNTSLDQQNTSTSCDYTDAALHGGWGWDSVAEESCPPQSSAESTVCIDSDGDGWGWDGQASCVIDD